MYFQIDESAENVPTDTVAEIRPLGARIPPPPDDEEGDTLPVVRPVRATAIIPPAPPQLKDTGAEVPRHRTESGKQ